MEGRPGPQAVPHFIQALIEKVLLGDTDAMSLLAAGTTPHARWPTPDIPHPYGVDKVGHFIHSFWESRPPTPSGIPHFIQIKWGDEALTP